MPCALAEAERYAKWQALAGVLQYALKYALEGTLTGALTGAFGGAWKRAISAEREAMSEERRA